MIISLKNCTHYLSVLSIIAFSGHVQANTDHSEFCTDESSLVCVTEVHDLDQSESYGSNQSFYEVSN